MAGQLSSARHFQHPAWTQAEEFCRLSRVNKAFNFFDPVHQRLTILLF
jgi:hypothetical protein